MKKNVNTPRNPTAPAAHLAYFIEVTGMYNSLSVDGGLDPLDELFTKNRIIEMSSRKNINFFT